MIKKTDNIIRFPGASVAEIEAVAAHWLARITSGSLTLGELAEFEFWRVASPEHDRNYLELKTMWDRMGTGAARFGLYHRILAGFHSHIGSARWPARLGQVAAAAAAVIVAGQYLTTWRYDYHTDAGQVRRVTLADGSIVQMKGDTAMNVHVTSSGERLIDLARGEAFFEVVHDAARPFTVNVGNGAVHDIGTGFSVARAGRMASVMVEHGVVAVVASGLSETLKAGDQVSFSLYGIGRKTMVDPDAIAPWRRGLYIAEGRPLGQVLSDIDEYYPGRIIVTSRKLAMRRVNAVVQFGRTEAWLDALDKTPGVAVKHWGPFAIVGDRIS